jgi:hypothetical protein
MLRSGTSPLSHDFVACARHTLQFSGITMNFHTADAKDNCIIFSLSCVKMTSRTGHTRKCMSRIAGGYRLGIITPMYSLAL